MRLRVPSPKYTQCGWSASSPSFCQWTIGLVRPHRHVLRERAEAWVPDSDAADCSGGRGGGFVLGPCETGNLGLAGRWVESSSWPATTLMILARERETAGRPNGSPLGTFHGGLDSRQPETVAPACAPFRKRCRACGTAPSDHDGPDPVLNESLEVCHRPGLLPTHLGSVTDPPGLL